MFDSGDRWLAAWSLGYAAVGAASVLVPLYAIELGADAFVVAVVAATGTSIVARLSPAAVRGDALGAYTALGGVGTAVGSLLGGVLATELGYVGAFAGAAALVLAGVGVAAGAVTATGEAEPVTG